tara:strand:+ start:829 stop:1695 length:867 start_codon:yes stop_codon:yes gene_type:complete
MSISRQNLTIVIVTLKSENVIHKCLESISSDVPVIIIENSDNKKFKEELESKYQNIKCILSGSNLGMGTANNIGIKYARTDYVYILNPDVTLEKNTLEQLFLFSHQLKDFTILSPINSDLNFPNYKGQKNKEKENHPFQVDYVDGFSMLLNKKKFNNDIYFDENFFLYLENHDLCLRANREGGSVYIVPTAKVYHTGSSAVDSKHDDEVEFSRNWHWVWSKFYFNKKNFNFFKAIKECFPTYISSILKFLFYTLINNKFKKRIYLNRTSGFYNALIGKSSWYRPKIDN